MKEYKEEGMDEDDDADADEGKEVDAGSGDKGGF